MKSYKELMEAKDEEDEFKAAVDRIKNNKSSDMLKMLEKSFLKNLIAAFMSDIELTTV